MGRPSDARRSARRPGKRERTRVKKHRRPRMSVSVPGAGWATLKAGLKKWHEAVFSMRSGNPFSYGRRFSSVVAFSGEPIVKADAAHGTARLQSALPPF